MNTKPKGDLWLQLHYWTLVNSSLLKKWWVIVLLGLTVFVIVFTLTNAVVYTISLPREVRLIRAMASVMGSTSSAELTPAPLDTGTPTVLPAAAKGTYDLAVHVQNVNTQWTAASITYTFQVDGKATGSGTAVLMPGAETYLAVFGQSLSAATGQQKVSVEIQTVQWKRTPSLQESLGDIFKIDTPRYSVVEETRPPRKIGSVTATVSNASLDGWWQVKFVVVLMGGGRVVGVNTVFLERFTPRSTRTVTAQWTPVPTSSVDSILIFPEIDLNDAGARMPTG